MEGNFIYSSHDAKSKNGTECKMPVEKTVGMEIPFLDQSVVSIDLNEHLVRNRLTTFFMRVNCESMTGAGIHLGDVVIVDRSLDARSGTIVIAVLDHEMLIRTLDISNHKKRLLPATHKLSPIDINESSSFYIWGVVTFVIHSV